MITQSCQIFAENNVYTEMKKKDANHTGRYSDAPVNTD